jgi:prepilin-type N-terminal cleavage/methylation domain-containing protein
MKKHNSPQQDKKFLFRGFTLLELLIVMSIISVLIALLLPAINRARIGVRVAQVKTEITQLDQALANFKVKFGEYPPSYIKLRVGYDPDLFPGVGWDDTADPETVTSKEVISNFWPDFDFNTAAANIPWADGVELYGAECLVFFLGGVNDVAGSKKLIGFSKNPSNPFTRAGTNRDRPLFEFDASRLDPDPALVNGLDNGLSYLDPMPGQQKPYIYTSAYGGTGYNPADLSDPAEVSDSLTGAYSQSVGNNWKPLTFQIISPGQDGAYGPGGVFDTTKADTALIINGDIDGDDTPDGIDRSAERDNITNFHKGQLAP